MNSSAGNKKLRSGVLWMLDALHVPHLVLNARGAKSFIVLYHGVTSEKGEGMFNYRAKFITPESFRAQIRWLKQNYRVVPLTEITNTIVAGSPVPDGLVAITFDDGYENNFSQAFPILKEENVPATFFITTDFVNEQKPLPVDIIEYAIGNTTKDHISIELDAGRWTFSLRSYEERVQTDLLLRARMKKLSGPDAKTFLDALIRAAGIDLWRDLMHTPYRPMSWENIREMENGGMTFAAHTRSHPILSRLSPDEIDSEIADSAEILRAHCKQPLSVFAYPNGSTKDFNDDVIATLQKNGFVASLTTRSGIIKALEDPFRISRYTLDGTNEMYRFRLTISGVIGRLARLFG